MTPEELACGYTVNPPDDEWTEDGDYWFADEDYLLCVAGAVSIDPSMIEQDFPDAGPGFIGTLG